MSYSQADWGAGYFDANIASMSAPFSVVVWIKKSAAQWDAGGADYIGNLADQNSADTNQLRLITAAADSVRGQWIESGSVQNSTYYWSTASANTFDDVWVPYMAVYASPTDKRVYIENSTRQGNVNTTSRDITVDHFRLGRLNAGFGGFEGKIAEVAIFNKALSSAELDAFQTSAGAGPTPISVNQSACVGYWPLNSASSQHNDASDAANGAFVAVGSTFYDADHPTITAPAGSSILNAVNYYFQQA